jgi:hypothetical protein
MCSYDYDSKCDKLDAKNNCDACGENFCDTHFIRNTCKCKNTGYYLALCVECMYEYSPEDIMLICDNQTCSSSIIYVCCFTPGCGKICKICDKFTCNKCYKYDNKLELGKKDLYPLYKYKCKDCKDYKLVH